MPPGEVWVHCQAGYRASVAASLLHAAGRTVTAIDDDFGAAAEAGFPVVPGRPASLASQPPDRPGGLAGRGLDERGLDDRVAAVPAEPIR
jgi:hypothetical protein